MEHNSFGSILQHYRTEAGLSRGELAQKAELTEDLISVLERDRREPTEQVINKISKAIDVPVEELLRYKKISSLNSDSAVVLVEPQLLSHIKYEEQIKNQSEKIKSESEKIKRILDDLKDFLQTNLSESNEIKYLSGYLIDSLNLISETSDELKSITAPVHLPPKEYMSIHLIPHTIFELLDNYRQDEKFWNIFFGASLGSLFSILVNLATGGTITASSFIIILLLGLFCITTGGASYVYRERGNKIKEQILSQLDPKTDDD